MHIEEIPVPGYERVAHAEDREAGYRAIVAVHSTALGPAVGGTRLWRYGSREEALTDALRLSRGMTYKNALAGLDVGGGKAVIMAPETIRDRRALFRAHGRFVAAFGGTSSTGEDVGTGPADMAWIAELAGLAVALQGCGNVGRHLALLLRDAGAGLAVTDVDPAWAARVAAECGARTVAPDEIYEVPADVFAPCALGGILNDGTIPRLAAGIVCGGANNQLLEPRHGEALAQRGVLYVPDYVANAGGVIAGVGDLRGEDAAATAARVEGIHDTVLAVLCMAEERGITPERAADELAEERLASVARGRGG